MLEDKVRVSSDDERVKKKPLCRKKGQTIFINDYSTTVNSF